MMNNKKFITRSGKTSSAEWVRPMRTLFYEKSTLIPDRIWLAGEFLYWRKTVAYQNLPSYFVVFAAIKGNSVLSWEETIDIANNANLPVVEVVAEGNNSDDVIAEAKKSWKQANKDKITQEGFVIRPRGEFALPAYADNVAKWVNSSHTPTATNNGVNGLLRT